MTEYSTNNLPGAGLQDIPSKVIATASGFQIEASMKPDTCKYCGQWVDPEYQNTHSDGSVSHESCHDNAEFERQNEMDSDRRAEYETAQGERDYRRSILGDDAGC